MSAQQSEHLEDGHGSPSVQRHRTALSRTSLSKPVRLALDAGLIGESVSVFDYGCGRGDDLRALTLLGVPCAGWDPEFRRDSARIPSDIVNLGYVVNVIENVEERARALSEAWGLASRLLIVAARLENEAKSVKAREFADGVMTTRGTFQKFYSQGELRDWIEAVLGAAPVAASPGVFFVFRDKAAEYAYAAAQFRRAVSPPPRRISDELFNKHQSLLEPLIAFVEDRGRTPEEDELAEGEQLREPFGSIARAFGVIRRVTGAQRWDSIAETRAQELLIHLALARFSGRPRWTDLPRPLQLDVRAFYGTYSRACDEADALLFSAGDISAVNRACSEAECGKLTPEALYIHTSSLTELQPILRVYEGCARRYIGVVEGANLVKLHRQKPQVSYLSYPRFDRDAHPALLSSVVVPLQTFDLRYRDYSASDNPFILHRKETFVHQAYKGRDKFARLTAQEVRAGLLTETESIGTSRGWEAALAARHLKLRGHRLVKA